MIQGIDYLLMIAPFVVPAFLGGYLLGSIPFGLIVTRFGGAGDIRSIGSGNIGATNVLRTGRKDLAAITLLFDVVKGALPVIVAGQLGGPLLMVWAGAGAFLGHLFPIWLRFKGGKGVAVGCGIILALSWPVGLLNIATWIIVALVFRVSSLAALYVAALTPFYFWLIDPRFQEFGALMALVVWVSHYANVARLWRGVEPRIGSRGKKAPMSGGPVSGGSMSGSGVSESKPG